MLSVRGKPARMLARRQTGMMASCTDMAERYQQARDEAELHSWDGDRESALVQHSRQAAIAWGRRCRDRVY